MKVTVCPCGPAANESELKAVEHLKKRLQSEPGDGHWVLLANLAFSVTHQLQSDEIDIVVIGPPGVRVIEVKHWTATWVREHREIVKQEAERVINKARKIGTTLRHRLSDLPKVEGVFLLTEQTAKINSILGTCVCGVRFFGLSDWKQAIQVNGPPCLAPREVDNLSRILVPRSAVAIDGSLRRLAGYVNLELQSPRDERFHRVYKGIHSARKDRVILHLYDLSASDSRDAETKARREFESLHRLQLYSWAPRVLDSFQDAPGYAGEMFFFTVVDPAAPTVEDRASDDTWSSSTRLEFARKAIQALRELHQAGPDDQPMIHRNLAPQSILVRYDNSPIITGFELTRIPSEVSVASRGVPENVQPQFVAPEVREHGLAAADQRSDVFSLCTTLNWLFHGRTDRLSSKACDVLVSGMAEKPEDRASLQDLDRRLAELLGESVAAPAPPSPRFWTEGQVILFRGREYRIVTRLGSGAMGATFKVVELEKRTQEELGTYVGKVVHDRETGERVLTAYRVARSHLRHTGLSTIFEVASEWEENNFVALLTWIEGTPLAEFTGVFPLLAEEQQEVDSQTLALRWIHTMCQALEVLHENDLIHGDVSPRNMIVSGSDLVLTDYDFVCKVGQPIQSPGTFAYCSPECREGSPASPSDDIYALAASFFHVVFEREPFRYGGNLEKQRGLNWDGLDREAYPVLAEFLDRATAPNRTHRFQRARDALCFLEEYRRRSATGSENMSREDMAVKDGPSASVSNQAGNAVASPRREELGATDLCKQRVEWLLSLLQSYPGSRWGNPETRGLDTPFAANTYVTTQLEETLLQDIRKRRVRLIILCGNAGDGKTALLQHLAQELKLGRHQSSQRILKGKLPGGPSVYMNLDGSAAWQGRSADELLDEFFEPFQQGKPERDIVHLLAINDGRLLEWIEGYEDRHGETFLTQELYSLLQEEAAAETSFIRFVNLNQRSLVGGISADGTRIETEFLDRLLDQLYGGREAGTIWAPCLSCCAKDRCEVFRAGRLFGPDAMPEKAAEDVRKRARSRLFHALQAVHLRGETHITVRELRAALVYILFGVHHCDDYHGGAAPGSSQESPWPYWDRAFAPESPARQGQLLRELARFDPALEAHPQIDRRLLSHPAFDEQQTAPRYPELSLASARRRAYFEWTEDHIEQVTGDQEALDLARGKHLRLFRSLAIENDPERLHDICRRLCMGISHLEDLPPQALDRKDAVPLRITPRTPTETDFWVEKPLAAFRIEADLPPKVEGIERLHRQAFLIYCYRDANEERLRLNAELFHMLLELSEGYQIGDVSMDDTFAHLSIFVQRLVREDERQLMAWNPSQDEKVYQVSAAVIQTQNGPRQQMIISERSEEFAGGQDGTSE